MGGVSGSIPDSRTTGPTPLPWGLWFYQRGKHTNWGVGANDHLGDSAGLVPLQFNCSI